MSQFGTFDNASDRHEIQVLFQRLGEELPEAEANRVRADWLQKLVAKYPVTVNPDMCHPVGAYMLFVQITGVLGVDIGEAAVALSKFVGEKAWRRKLS